MAEVAVAGGPRVEVEHGRAVAEAVAGVIRTVKADDAMAPVTVVVHSAWAGLSLRRALASGDFGPLAGGRPGLVNVAFITIARVAELLGAPILAKAGRRPLPPAVRNEAVRSALQAEPGMFAHAARHPSTVLALDRTYEELRRCPAELVDALAATSPRSAEVVRICRAARRRLSAWYDEIDLAEAALSEIASVPSAATEIGHLVTAGLEPLPPALDALVDQFASRQSAAPTVIVAGEPAPQNPAASVEAIITCPDPDEEVRAVLRRIAAEVERGTPLHRIAVLYPHDSYALMLHQQLVGAGIPFNGPGVRRLSDTPAGAALEGMLALADGGLRRNEVMDWLASAPILDADSNPVPATAWDRVSKAAGVVGGADQWQERLEEYAGASDNRAAEYQGGGDGGEEWKASAAKRDATLARSLRDFVSELNERLTTNLPDGRSWTEWSEWACGALERYLGNAFRHAHWPDEEQDSFVAVMESLSALAALDELGEPAEVSAFRSAASQALEAPAGRVGRFGDGVMVGPIRQGRNLVLDSVFVVGLTEGYLPAGSGRSGLLLDDDRQAALTGFGHIDHLRTLDTREIRQNRQASALEAALRSASGAATLTWSRSELRSARPHLPSRWLLAAAATLAGRYVGLEDLDDLSRGADTRFTEVVSFASGLSRVGGDERPASLFDRDIAQLNDWVNNRNGRLEDHPVALEGPAAAYAASAAERRTGFNRFSGKIDPAKLRLTRRHSATKLETWAACPFRWFLGEALRLSHEEPPEDVIQIAPRERGTLVHLILERYTQTLIDEPDSPPETIIQIAEEVFADFQRRGLTGKALLWDYQRQLILRELETFVALDDLKPVAAELSFGRSPDDNPPVEIEVGGEVIPFSGSADRVDRQGESLVVTDYKTGGAFKGLEKDPVMAGTKLQLHIYARAARALHGEPNTPVRARYWFVSEKGEFAEESVDLDRDSGRFEEVLEVITSGIKSGLFPARPGADGYFGFENCSFCDFSQVCPVDRDRHWEAVRNDPELIDYRKLAEPDPEGGPS